MFLPDFLAESEVKNKKRKPNLLKIFSTLYSVHITFPSTINSIIN